METLVFVFVFLLIISNLSKNKKGKTAAKTDADASAQKAAKPQREIKQVSFRMDEFFPKPAASAAGEGHSAPIVPNEGVSRAADFRGSLKAKTSEGECLCDPALEHDRNVYEDAASVYATEISDAPKLDLSARGIWQGVVMSEVLARPGQRFRR